MNNSPFVTTIYISGNRLLLITRLILIVLVDDGVPPRLKHAPVVFVLSPLWAVICCCVRLFELFIIAVFVVLIGILYDKVVLFVIPLLLHINQLLLLLPQPQLLFQPHL